MFIIFILFNSLLFYLLYFLVVKVKEKSGLIKRLAFLLFIIIGFPLTVASFTIALKNGQIWGFLAVAPFCTACKVYYDTLFKDDNEEAIGQEEEDNHIKYNK